MATAKKNTTAKKTTAKKPRSAAAKTTTRRKAPAKRTATSTVATPRTGQTKRRQSTFLTMTPTIETVYWIILGVVVILLAIWVLNLTAKINNIYNQIDIENASNLVIQTPHNTKHHTDK